MELGLIGLGRMGANMSRRLAARRAHGDRLCAPRGRPCRRLVADGRSRRARPRWPTSSRKLEAPRAVWLMVPAAAVDATLDAARAPARAGRHRHRRRQLLLPRRHPARRRSSAGAGIALRRQRHERRRVRPGARLLPDDRRSAGGRGAPGTDLPDARAGHRRGAPDRRAARGAAAPPSRATCTADRAGAGHFVKMVHNGIEYGMMAALRRGPEHPAPRQRRPDHGARSTPRRRPLRDPGLYQLRPGPGRR